MPKWKGLPAHPLRVVGDDVRRLCLISVSCCVGTFHSCVGGADDILVLVGGGRFSLDARLTNRRGQTIGKNL